MIELQQKLAELTSTPGELSQRAQQALQYRDLVARGEISPEEYQDLLRDLTRLDDIELAAAELHNQILFNQFIDVLKSIPIT
jgi:polyhydroxyalkanoate synthesis regulator phasin